MQIEWLDCRILLVDDILWLFSCPLTNLVTRDKLIRQGGIK